LFVLATIIFFLSLDWALARRKAAARSASPAFAGLAMSDFSARPGLFLAPGHTWLSLTADGDARVGVDDLARTAFGRPAAAKLPALGTRVKKGDPVLAMERNGHQIVFRSPVSGVVTAVNASPTRANEDGWFFTVRPARLGVELRALKIAEEAVSWLRGEAARFRDFLVESLNASPAMAAATLPDGGVPVEGVLAHLPADTVAAFQEEFLDVEE
jgi:glycine cleavage system H protein